MDMRQLPDVVKDASKETLEKATKEYAAAHHLTAKQAAEVDPICVLGEYYFRTTPDRLRRMVQVPRFGIPGL